MINSQSISNLNSSDTKDNPSSTLKQEPHLQGLEISHMDTNNNNYANIPDDIATKFSPSHSLHYKDGVYQPNSIYLQFLYSHDKWPANVERAFISALRLIIKSGTSKTKIRNRNYGRNELISLYIRFHTGEIRTKKQISSHIQVWKKSILSKLSSNITLTPLDSEVLNLIENGAEQNERSLSLFFTVFNEIIDAMHNDKNYQKYKDTIMGPSRSNSNSISRSGSNKINVSNTNNINGSNIYYQQSPQQQQQQQQMLQVSGQPVMVQNQNISGSPTYSILQSVPVMFVQDNLQPNILRPVTYSDGSFVIANRSPPPPQQQQQQQTQQRPEWGNSNNNSNTNCSNINNANNTYNNATYSGVYNINSNDTNKNVFENSFSNENKPSVQYQTYPYNYVEKPWTIPANNIISSTSSLSSTGSSISYPQWGAPSLSISNSDKTASSTTSSRTHELVSTTNNSLSPMRSKNNRRSQSISELNNSDNIQNSIASTNTYSPSMNSMNNHYHTNNEKVKLPPVAENQFFRANNDMLKSTALPSIPYSSYPMFNNSNNNNNNNTTLNNDNDNDIDNFNNYSMSRSSVSSTTKDVRKNSFNMTNNIVHKKSYSSPHNIPSNISRHFSTNENNVTILPPLSAYRFSEGDAGKHIANNQED